MAISFYKSKPGALVGVGGEDAWEFVQSQFSNDLRTPHSHAVTYGLWLDRKGKVTADSFLFQNERSGRFFCSYFCGAEPIVEKLEQNLVADDVILEDRTRNSVIYSWWGEGAETFLEFEKIEKPDTGQFTISQDRIVWRGRRSRWESFDLLTFEEDGSEIERSVENYIAKDGGCWASREALHAERLRSRIPWIPVEIGPTELPQEGFLEEDALSFDKGCYLGQEVISRLQSIGQVQRNLCLVEMEGWKGTERLPCDVYSGGELAGQLRSVANVGGKQQGHALLKKKTMTQNAKFSLRPGGKNCLKLIEG